MRAFHPGAFNSAFQEQPTAAFRGTGFFWGSFLTDLAPLAWLADDDGDVPMLRRNVSGQRWSFRLLSSSTGAAVTGATVTVTRTIDGGSPAAATSTVTELGGGQYRINFSAADLDGEYVGVLITATGAVPLAPSFVTTALDPHNAATGGLTGIAAQVWDYLVTSATTAGSMGKQLLAKLALIVPGRVTVVSTVVGSIITLYKGDDHYAADSREVSLVSDEWANLTTATAVTLTILEGTRVVATYTGILGTTGASGDQDVYWQPTAAQTVLLTVGTPAYTFGATCTLSSGRKYTLRVGTVHVVRSR